MKSSFYYNRSKKVCYRRLAFLGFSRYKVGTDGSVWHLKYWKGRKRQRWWRKRKVVGSPYLHVVLSQNRKRKIVQVHSLVLMAFVGPCPPGMLCRHFPDRDPTNNRLENLQWSTQKENLADRKVHGTVPDAKRLGQPGERNAHVKLTERAVKWIRKEIKKDKRHGRYRRLRDRVNKKFGISVTKELISLVANRKAWKHI